MAWLYDFRDRLEAEIAQEAVEIASGQCIPLDADIGGIAISYKERIGYVNGLKRALSIAQELYKESA